MDARPGDRPHPDRLAPRSSPRRVTPRPQDQSLALGPVQRPAARRWARPGLRSGPSSPPRRRPPAEHGRRGCRDDARDGSRPGRRAHVGPHNAVRRPAAPPEGLAKFVFRAVRPTPLRPRGAEGRLAWVSRRRSGRAPTCSRVLNRAPWPGPPRGRASKEPRQNQEFWALLLSTAFCGAEGRPPRLSDGAATGKWGGRSEQALCLSIPGGFLTGDPVLGVPKIFGIPLLYSGIVGVACATSQQGIQCCQTHGILEKPVTSAGSICTPRRRKSLSCKLVVHPWCSRRNQPRGSSW